MYFYSACFVVLLSNYNLYLATVCSWWFYLKLQLTPQVLGGFVTLAAAGLLRIEF